MKTRRKLFAAVSSLAVALTVLLTGCAEPEGAALRDTGTLTLSVNPEIQIEYDEAGRVLALTGRNEDGKGIVEVYTDYIGKGLRRGPAGPDRGDPRGRLLRGRRGRQRKEHRPAAGAGLRAPGRRLPGGDVRQHAGRGPGAGPFLRHRDHRQRGTTTRPMRRADSRRPTSPWRRRRRSRSPRRTSRRRRPCSTTGTSTTTTAPRSSSWNLPPTETSMNTTSMP